MPGGKEKLSAIMRFFPHTMKNFVIVVSKIMNVTMDFIRMREESVFNKKMLIFIKAVILELNSMRF